MQAYNRAFARIYNEQWIGFAQHVAPRIQEYYESTPASQVHRSLLDLCCGSGQLAVHFLTHGYRVVGIDLSEAMLDHARKNAAEYVQRGQARFIQADAAHFELDERCGLVVSTFDALNHLPGKEALRSCFASVYPVLEENGVFIFDLNTRAGLREQWSGISVQDRPELMIVNRGLYDEESERAWVRISGFVRTEGGLYERFEQTAYNTAFDLEETRAALLDAGWRHVHFARVQDLGTPLAEPEKERRVFVVAAR
jgi:SAM-dependent methyltransferase